VSHVKPIDATYKFHAEFIGTSSINVDQHEDLRLKVFFNGQHSYSEQIIVKIIDEDRNRFVLFMCHAIRCVSIRCFSFDYEVFVTADNSIFTCYSFLWKSENDYQIVVQQGQIMKGSRIKSDQSHASGNNERTSDKIRIELMYCVPWISLT
jgi:hypothetical protein